MNLDKQRKNIVNELEDQDCAVCLQKYHYPTKLPCGHVFCFLCVKGIAIQGKKCAMCRKQIPSDYFNHPVLLGNLPSDEISIGCSNEEYQWYYEGRNGWWKYDERSNIELESVYNSGETQCMLLLAGTLYCVDFQNMLQFRRNDPSRRRRVRRDVPSLPSKGIAGIKKIENTQEPSEVNGDIENITTIDIEQDNEHTQQVNEVETVHNQNENHILPATFDTVVQSLRDMTLGNQNESSSSVEEHT